LNYTRAASPRPRPAMGSRPVYRKQRLTLQSRSA